MRKYESGLVFVDHEKPSRTHRNMSVLQWVEATTNLEKNPMHGTMDKVMWSAAVECSVSLLDIGMTHTELGEAEAIKLLGFGKSFSSL